MSSNSDSPINNQPSAPPSGKPSKSDQARANGAKSHGPSTPEGKARSSRNAIKHAYCSSAVVVLSNENMQTFLAMRRDFIGRFHPADAVEFDLVETLAGISWKRHQNIRQQSALIDRQMTAQSENELKDANIDETMRSTYAVESLENSGTTLSNLRRYEAQLHRNFTRTLKALLELRKDRREFPPEQNEPSDLGEDEDDNHARADPAQSDAPLAKRSIVLVNKSIETADERPCPACEIVMRVLMPHKDMQILVLDALREADRKGEL